MRKNCFSLKLFWIFSFKIDTSSITLDTDPNWAKILDLDPDPNSMFLDPQHCFQSKLFSRIRSWCNFLGVVSRLKRLQTQEGKPIPVSSTNTYHRYRSVLRSRSIFDRLRFQVFFSPTPASAPIKKKATIIFFLKHHNFFLTRKMSFFKYLFFK